MKISVVIPTFNEEKYIQKCLESIFNQDDPADEVIVVNNNSTDKTVEIAKKFPVRIINEKTQSLIAARNRGFDEANYEIIARIDADCIIPKDWTKQIKKFFDSMHYDAFTGPIRYYGLFPKPTPALTSRIHLKLIKLLNHRSVTLQGSNMILKRDIWKKIRNKIHLDDKKVLEDLDLSLNILKADGKIGLDPDLVVQTSARRIKEHPESFFIEYNIRIFKTFRINKM